MSEIRLKKGRCVHMGYPQRFGPQVEVIGDPKISYDMISTMANLRVRD